MLDLRRFEPLQWLTPHLLSEQAKLTTLEPQPHTQHRLCVLSLPKFSTTLEPHG